MSHHKLSTDQCASIHSLSEIDTAMYTPHGQILGPRHLLSVRPCTGTCYIELGIRHDNFSMKKKIDGYTSMHGVTAVSNSFNPHREMPWYITKHPALSPVPDSDNLLKYNKTSMIR